MLTIFFLIIFLACLEKGRYWEFISAPREFSNNKFFTEWNNYNETHHLIEYLLPTEDLEDLNLIKEKYDFIEQYDFKEITSKYNLNDSIIALIFKNEKTIRILSRINVNDKIVLKNQSFLNIFRISSLILEISWLPSITL